MGEMPDHLGLFDGVLARGEVRSLAADTAWRRRCFGSRRRWRRRRPGSAWCRSPPPRP